jgi:hypothetical protein
MTGSSGRFLLSPINDAFGSVTGLFPHSLEFTLEAPMLGENEVCKS